MRIRIIPCLRDNYAYLLIDDRARAVVVDPSEAPPVIEAVQEENVSLEGIWLTHHHWDHVGGIEGLSDRYADLEVVGSVHDHDKQRIPRQTKAVAEGDSLSFGGLSADIYEIPGHTLGAIGFVIDGCLFSGDTLFLAGCGRLFEGTPAMMQASFEKLRALPPETRIYCGHEYTASNLNFAASVEPDNEVIAESRTAAQQRGSEPTVPGTLAHELETNPFMRWDAPAVIDHAKAAGASADPGAVFGAIRSAKDNF